MEKTISDIEAEKYLEYLVKKISKDFPEFSKNLAEFNSYNLTREMKPNTRLNYIRVLIQYAKWLKANGITEFNSVNKEIITNYISSLMNKGLSTRNWHKIAIKVFYRWLVTPQEDKTYPPLVDWIKLKRENYKRFKKSELISNEEFERILDFTKSIRDRALWSVLYWSGCRISEILNMKIKDIKLESDRCLIHVRGKTGERDVLLFEPIKEIKTWLKFHPFSDNNDSYVFVNSEGKVRADNPLLYRVVFNNLKRVLTRAGITKRIWLHLFRHSAATRFANEGYTDMEQKLRHGWSIRSRMQERYTHQSVEDLNMRILEKKGIETKSKKDTIELEGNNLLQQLMGEVKKLKKDVGILKKK